MSKKSFTVKIHEKWCKACGLCAAFCPVQIIKQNDEGKAYVDDMEKCIGCRMCSMHCPDFCFDIEEK